MRYFFIAILLWGNFLISAQNQLSKKQEVWLYRIVQKTPVLKRNWHSYFVFDQTPFLRYKNGQHRVDHNAISYYQFHNPESLIIHYDSIQLSSYGLISEAAIKLTLWELNEELKKCIYHQSDCNDSLFNSFEAPLQKLINKTIKPKKQDKALHTIIHPSLPIFKKFEELQKLKLSADIQKKLLNKWSELVANYSHERSQYYFNLLANGQTLTSTTFLAAGEGSGTAGLLYETEHNPEDSTKAWYGKGIGLFTYKVRTYKEEVRLQTHLSKKIKLPKGKSMAMHTSLWGLNSSFKPMLIITDDSVSYHLFANFNTKELSPDENNSHGISHIDRIEEYRQKKILNPLKNIQNNGSLADIINKEYVSKTLIENQLSEIEAEIDTLLKYEPDNEEAINYRKRLIDSKLTNLSKKEQRIKELQQKLSKENSSITHAEQKLKEMITLLGPSPQEWTKEGNTYHFNTGVKFNTLTQDLIFPPRHHERALDVRLLSAGYSLEGTKKDEVQAYVSITDTRNKAPVVISKQIAKIDTSLTFYFHPDEYHTYSSLDFTKQFIKQLKSYKHLSLEIGMLLRPDSLKSMSRKYSDKAREYQLPLTINAHNRMAQLTIQTVGDTLKITSLACTDPVPTRIHQAPVALQEAINIKGLSSTNNKYLQALRATQVLLTLFDKLNYPVTLEELLQIDKHIPINDEELSLIINYLHQ